MDFELKKPLTALDRDGKITYGGSQMLSPDKDIQRCGCGIVAAAELMLYLARRGELKSGLFSRSNQGVTNLDYYNSLLDWLRRRFVPIIPPFGATGIGLAAGVNALFRRLGLPYSARWRMKSKGFYESIESMLREDLPVVLSIGPDFPRFWEKERLDLYRRSKAGEYEKASSAKGHYLIVTGMDSQWLQVSSWGYRFFINRREYDEFVSQHSSYIVSNILEITKKL